MASCSFVLRDRELQSGSRTVDVHQAHTVCILARDVCKTSLPGRGPSKTGHRQPFCGGGAVIPLRPDQRQQTPPPSPPRQTPTVVGCCVLSASPYMGGGGGGGGNMRICQWQNVG